MVHDIQIEEQKLKQVYREFKRLRTEDGNSYKTKFGVQDKLKFKRRFTTKSLLLLQGSIRVRCLLRITKRRKVVILMLRNIFVQNVVENMMVRA